MGKKSSTTAVSKISSAASPTAPSPTSSGQKSSILKSAFTPSRFQLHLFASVIQSFESQQLRIHDTTTGKLRCHHATKSGTRITSLDWGFYGPSSRQDANSRKKRKRDSHQVENVVVAYGTNTSEICIFSLSKNKVVATLTGHHERGIRDFKFSSDEPSEGWSIGGDGTLVQWDLNRNMAIRDFALSDSATSVLASPTHTKPEILCASTTPFSIDISSSEAFRIEAFDSFKTPVQSIFRSGAHTSNEEEYFLAADNDRYINIYHLAKHRLVRTLIAGSEVEFVDFLDQNLESDHKFSQQMLAVVTRDGTVELFSNPFSQPATVNGDLKSSRKNLTKKASASIRLVTSEAKTKTFPIFATSIQGPDLIIASAESGVDVAFQKIRWQDEGSQELLFEGLKDVIRIKSKSTLNTATTNGVKDMSQVHVDESRTVVVDEGALTGSQEDAIEIDDSDEEEEEVDIETDSEDSMDENVQKSEIVAPLAEEESDSDQDMNDYDDSETQVLNNSHGKYARKSEDIQEQGQPSFGEVLAAQQQRTIAIADDLPPESSALAVVDSGHLSLPSGMSLGTVLTQSLRTNDRSLLEACLHTTDVDIIKNTIQRLDSSLAGTLLSKLAERLSTRPGRYGHLLTWVQWTCIAHGGAIATQPSVTGKIQTLYKVLTQRAKSLDNLLLLKGKLDMLDAQLTFRKELRAQRQPRQLNQDEPGMIYIEGEEDNWSSSEEDVDETAGTQNRLRKRRQKALEDAIENEGSSEDDEDVVENDKPMPNGISHADTDSEDEEDIESDAGLINDEAEVSSINEDDSESEEDESSDEQDEDDDDSVSELEEDEEEIQEDTTPKPPSKKIKF